MKKALLGLSLSVAALGFLMSPAMAASPPQAAPVLSLSDQDFLASLAVAPVTTPAPENAAHRPAIGAKSLCTATATCWNGGTVSCSGNNSVTSCSGADGNCSAGERGHVTCDGVTTSCPTACPCSLNCATERANCIADCDPCPILFSCSTTTCTVSCQCRFTRFCLQ